MTFKEELMLVRCQRPRCMDEMTKRKSRLQFARVLIDMEIKKNPPEAVKFVNENGVILEQKICYEWKPTRCGKCQGFGHKDEECEVLEIQTNGGPFTWNNRQMGDENSKFFHASMREKSRRNKIRAYQNSNGNIVENWDDVETHFVEYFKDLLGGWNWTPPVRIEVFTKGKRLSLENQVLLLRTVEEREIKDAIMSIGSNKSPGPDGFGAGFFKATWDIIGGDVVQAAKEFFREGKLLKQVNNTLISLIPKNEMPRDASEFRPIACCNVFYKCLSKILSNRMSLVLPEIVNENQGAFVKGGLLMHNVLIAQELIRLYKRKNVKPSCIIKVDLRKAYDMVDWKFLREALQAYAFPEKTVELIMQCVTSTSFSLNLNGNITGFFQGKRGIRQGDPLSPLLFVLVMEYLTRLFKEEIDRGSIKFHPMCEQQEITTLRFADDLLIVCETEENGG